MDRNNFNSNFENLSSASIPNTTTNAAIPNPTKEFSNQMLFKIKSYENESWMIRKSLN